MHHLAVLTDQKLSTETSFAMSHEPALIIDKPVRTGQQIYAKNRDLVVLNLVSPGAELVADGSIHVYAPLRGRALAGAQGNAAARIFTASMQAELISIAGIYKPLDETLPNDLNQKAVQIFLDQQKLVIEALQF
jgi:septum site-determining protein MinC